MAETTPPEIAVDEVEILDDVVDANSALPQGEPCPNCGSPVEPLDKFCPACGAPHAVAAPQPRRGSPAEVVTAEVLPESAADRADDEEPDKRYFRCESCGSEVGVDPEQRSYVCPFCDSTYVVEFAPETSGRQRPEFIIGFAVTPDDALEKFRHWLANNSWFRPGDLAQAKIEEKMKGVYLPFWSFSMLAESRWGAEIGEYWYTTETYTTTDSKGRTQTRTRRVQHTEWWNLSGQHHRYYSGYLVSGSRGLSQADAERIKPFQLPALKRYEPYFLAGWLAEEYSVAREAALDASQQYFYAQEQRNITLFLPGDTSRGLQVSTRFRDANSDLCLLPVYVLSYRYQEKIYRFLVNGQTGKLAGDKPVSWRRIGVAIGIGVAVVAVVALAIALLSNL